MTPQTSAQAREAVREMFAPGPTYIGVAESSPAFTRRVCFVSVITTIDGKFASFEAHAKTWPETVENLRLAAFGAEMATHTRR